MIRKTTRFAVYRNLLLIFAVLIAAMLQNAAGAVASTADVGLFLLIPLCVSIAMFEKEFAGMFYGILIGAVWDIASPLTDGIFALFFALTACICGLLTHYLMRNTLKTALLFTACSVTLFCIVSVLFNCLPRDTGEIASVIKYFYVPSGLITVIILPVTYYPVRAVERRFRTKSDI